MTDSDTKKIIIVAGLLTLWGQTKIYNDSPHNVHRIAMVVGGTVLYALGLGKI
jgi:hypothetical protein